MCGAPGHSCGGSEPKNMLTIPKEVEQIMTTHIALDRIYAADPTTGEVVTLAYAPGDKIRPEDIEALEAAGATLGDVALRDDPAKLTKAMAKAADAHPDGIVWGDGAPVAQVGTIKPPPTEKHPGDGTPETKEGTVPETKDVRGPKDKPKGK